MNDVYGIGFAFPPVTDPATGTFSRVGDTAVVEQALRVLIKTAPGERLMRPDYGCDLRRYLFAPNTVATRRLLAEEISRAITLFEDRVVLKGVEVTADELEPAQVDIVVRYTLRRSGTPGALASTFRLDGARS